MLYIINLYLIMIVFMFVNDYQSKIHNIEEMSDSSDPCMSFQMLWPLVTMNPGNLRLGAVSL